jgi:type VI secretion system secreted protein Hcp
MDVLILDCSAASIEGECLLTGYEKKIEVLSYSTGMAMQITGDQSNTKRTSGKPNIQDFTVTKFQDLATNKFVDFCLNAKPISKMTITVGQNDAGKVTKIYVYEFDNVIVSSYSVGGGGGGKPTETLTFNFTKLTWTYTAQKTEVSEAGNSPVTWDITKNTNK